MKKEKVNNSIDRHSKEYLQALVSTIPGSIFVMDSKGIFLDYESNDEKNLTMPKEAFINRDISEAIPGEFAELVKINIEKILRSGEPAIFEYKLPIKEVWNDYECRMVSFGKDNVIALVNNITNRKNSEKEFHRLSALQELLARLSSNFINIPLDRVDSEINDALKDMGEFVSADRAYIFNYDFDANICNNTFEWCEEGITPQILELQDVPLVMMPDWVETHSRGAEMNIPDVPGMPEGPIKDILMPQEIKSLLTIPLMRGKNCIGFVGFDSVKKFHIYGEVELKLLRLFGEMLVNISERREGEKALIDSRNNYESLVGNVPGITYRCFLDDYWTMYYLSNETRKITGYDPGEFINNSVRSFASIILEEDQEYIMPKIKKSIEERKIWEIEYRIRHKDNSIRWLFERGRGVFNEKGELIYLDGFILDNTERKDAERLLRKQSVLQQMLMNISSKYINIPLSEIEVSIRESLEELGRFVDADRAYIFNYDFERRTTSNTYEWCAGGIEPQINELQNIPMEYVPYWVERHKSGKELLYEDIFVLPEGDPVREILEPQGIKSLITIPMISGDECMGFVGFDWVKGYHSFSEVEKQLLGVFSHLLVNIRNRSILERNLIKEKKNAEVANRAKSEFLANISHEIRTPMNSILGFSEVMLNTVSGERDKNYLKTILSSGKTLLALINEILDLSKIEAGKMEISPEPADLRLIINENADIFSHKIKEKNLELFVVIDENFPLSIVIDELRLRQILLNLMENAIKFTEKGFVKIELTTLNRKEESIDFAISVSDTGIGIEEEERGKIFEYFSQKSGQDERKYGGTGLGLSISKRLSELMNGKICVESEPGKGSVFTVTFDDVRCSEETVETEENFFWKENRVIFKGAKILIADDIPHNRELVVSYVQNHDLKIVEAHNGRYAVEMAEAYLPDLIFMDIRMPGLSGIEATKILKENPITSKIPIVALTAISFGEGEEGNIKTMFDGYIRKPISRKQIMEELLKHLPHEVLQRSEEAGSDQFSESEAKESIPEIDEETKREFQLQFSEELDSISKTMIIDDILLFAKRLKEFGNSHKLTYMERKSEDLKNYVEEFNFQKMENSLRELREIFS